MRVGHHSSRMACGPFYRAMVGTGKVPFVCCGNSQLMGKPAAGVKHQTTNLHFHAPSLHAALSPHQAIARALQRFLLGDWLVEKRPHDAVKWKLRKKKETLFTTLIEKLFIYRSMAQLLKKKRFKKKKE